MQPDFQRISLFTTCPASDATVGRAYLRRIIDAARWSEQCGATGMLVYSDNSLVDPWLVSQLIVQNTTTLAPLVAVQPIYMHPYTTAKLVASIGYLHGRRLFLNMVAGGFTNDLRALNDSTPHDRRYDRLVEYTRIVTGLLSGESVIAVGEFYRVDRLKLAPTLPADLAPGIMLSGSSSAGLAAARALGGIAVKYPKPSTAETVVETGLMCGARVGIIARPDGAEAWRIARARFPEDRKGQLTHQLAMKTSDSLWHRQLSELGGEPDSAYWLVPFQNYKTMCPYLVGSYAVVADELSRYITLGYRTFILDVPPDGDDLQHCMTAFGLALQPVAS